MAAQPQPAAQQRGDQQANDFQPNEFTYWFAEPRLGIERLVEIAISNKYGRMVGRVTTKLSVPQMNERHTVVPIWLDTRSPVLDPETKQWRPRVVKGEGRDEPTLTIGKPVHCRNHANVNEETGHISMQLVNLYDESQRQTVPGLLGAITDACKRTDVRGREVAGLVHPDYHAIDQTIQLSSL